MSSIWSARWIAPLIGLTLAGCVTPQGDYRTSTTSPAFALTTDDAQDRLVVSSAVDPADWNRLTIKADKASRFRLNADVTASTGTALPANTAAEITHSQDSIRAAEFIDLCTTATGITFTITDPSVDQVMGTWTFTSIAPCS